MIAWVLAIAVILAGIGWLDLLRRQGLAGVGPRVPGALPLEQLAANDAQPLLRLMAAWLPVGALSARALAAGSRLSTHGQIVALVFVAALLLGFVGAVSDAATISGPLSEHVLPQLWRAGTVVAVVLIGLGAMAAAWASRAVSPVPSAR